MNDQITDNSLLQEFSFCGAISFKLSIISHLLNDFILPSPIQERISPTIWIQEYIDSLQCLLQDNLIGQYINQRLLTLAVGQGDLKSYGLLDALFAVPPLESFYRGLFMHLTRFGRCGIFGLSGMGKSRLLNYIAMEWSQTYETPVFFIENPQKLDSIQWNLIESKLDAASKEFGPYKILLIIDNIQNVLDIESHRNVLSKLLNGVSKNTYAIIFSYTQTPNPPPDIIYKEEFFKDLCGPGLNPVNIITSSIWGIWQKYMQKWTSWMASRILSKIALNKWIGFMEKGLETQSFSSPWAFINGLAIMHTNFRKIIFENTNPMAKIVYLLLHSYSLMSSDKAIDFNAFKNLIFEGIVSVNKEKVIEPLDKWVELWQNPNNLLLPNLEYTNETNKSYKILTIFHEAWAREVIRLLFDENLDTGFKHFVNQFLERAYPKLSKLWLQLPNDKQNASFFDWILLKCRFDSFDLLNVRQLALENCGFQQFPELIFEFTQLEILNLNYNRLEIVPNDIDSLKKLKQLKLENNQICIIDPGLGLLPNLEELSLKENYLRTLPETIGNLQKLITLNLNANSLVSIPKTIGMLQALKILNLESNNIGYLPETIGNLHHLVHLNLDKNNLEELPFSIGNLTELNYLSINSNQLQNLPESICGLKLLNTLSLYSNNINDVPIGICELKDLQFLYLFSNKIKLLPADLGNLTTLREIKIGSNNLQMLPESLGKLQLLNHLNASNNQIESIPESIGNLQLLRTLNLDRNRIKSLPETIGKLKLLNSFSILFNDLEDLPSTIKDLQNLQKLALWGNKLLTSSPKNRDFINSLKRTGLTITK